MSKSNSAQVRDMIRTAQELIGQATEALQLSERFPAEPEPGTILVFLKGFPTGRYQMAYADEQDRNTGIEAVFNEKVVPPMPGRVEIIDYYTYAALCVAPGMWYTTSQIPRDTKKTWDELAEFIGDAPCKKVVAYELVPRSGEDADTEGVSGQGAPVLDFDTIVANLVRGRRTKAHAVTMATAVFKAAGLAVPESATPKRTASKSTASKGARKRG